MNDGKPAWDAVEGDAGVVGSFSMPLSSLKVNVGTDAKNDGRPGLASSELLDSPNAEDEEEDEEDGNRELDCPNAHENAAPVDPEPSTDPFEEFPKGAVGNPKTGWLEPEPNVDDEKKAPKGDPLEEPCPKAESNVLDLEAPNGDEVPIEPNGDFATKGDEDDGTPNPDGLGVVPKV
jgi:hypothetical protein